MDGRAEECMVENSEDAVRQGAGVEFGLHCSGGVVFAGLLPNSESVGPVGIVVLTALAGRFLQHCRVGECDQ